MITTNLCFSEFMSPHIVVSSVWTGRRNTPRTHANTPSHHKHWSPQALVTTNTSHHKHWSPQALVTTNTSHHKHWSPQALDTTSTGHHKHWSPQALVTTSTSHHKHSPKLVLPNLLELTPNINSLTHLLLGGIVRWTDYTYFAKTQTSLATLHPLFPSYTPPPTPSYTPPPVPSYIPPPPPVPSHTPPPAPSYALLPVPSYTPPPVPSYTPPPVLNTPQSHP